jgi:hypothetical protein
MKSPRDVLLQHHEAANSQLDAIRHKVVANLKTPPDGSPQRQTSAGFFHEFLLPLRWHLAGMSALWVLAVLLSMDGSSSTARVAENSAPPVRVLAALYENRRQLAEMIDARADEVATPVPQPVMPRRRSALEPSSVIV